MPFSSIPVELPTNEWKCTVKNLLFNSILNQPPQIAITINLFIVLTHFVHELLESILKKLIYISFAVHSFVEVGKLLLGLPGLEYLERKFSQDPLAEYLKYTTWCWRSRWLSSGWTMWTHHAGLARFSGLCESISRGNKFHMLIFHIYYETSCIHSSACSNLFQP